MHQAPRVINISYTLINIYGERRWALAYRYRQGRHLLSPAPPRLPHHASFDPNFSSFLLCSVCLSSYSSFLFSSSVSHCLFFSLMFLLSHFLFIFFTFIFFLLPHSLPISLSLFFSSLLLSFSLRFPSPLSSLFPLLSLSPLSVCSCTCFLNYAPPIITERKKTYLL